MESSSGVSCVDALDDATRQRALTLGILQGVLGTIGAWLVGGWFLNFFAMELGAQGTMMGIFFAIPNFIAVVRIAAPYFVNRCDNRKAVWLGCSVVGRVLSLGLPLLAFPQFRPPGVNPVWILIALICAITIVDTVGGVAFISWFADLVPEGIWGRYFARRNLFMAVPVGLVPLVGGYLMDQYVHHHPAAKLTAYAVVYCIGIAFNLIALLPLVTVPNLKLKERREDPPLLSVMFAPFKDTNFRRYAFFYCWLMLGNGIPQAAFQTYLKNYLLVALVVVGALQAVNQVFSMLGSALSGRLTDRFGNKPILILGLIGAATGPFFWLPSSKENWYSIFGAYVVWGVGWAAVGLASQNLMLKISPRGNNVGYIAASQALGGICVGLTMMLGGWWLELLLKQHAVLQFGSVRLNPYQLFFLLSFLGRSSAALWVFRIREPGARTITHMVGVLRRYYRRRRRPAPLPLPGSPILEGAVAPFTD